MKKKIAYLKYVLNRVIRVLRLHLVARFFIRLYRKTSRYLYRKLKPLRLRVSEIFDACYCKIYSRFCKIDQKKVIFDCFRGNGYGESPKYIAEEIHRQGLGWDMVWMLNDTDMPLPPYVRAVKYDSYKAKREMSTAKVLVDNIRNSVRAPKRAGQIYLQTWHGGMSFKKLERETEEGMHPEYKRKAMLDGAQCDGIISACALQTEDYKQNFWLNPKTEILEYGQPRCDVLFDVDPQKNKAKVCDALNLPYATKIILYAPTFRDDGRTDGYKLDHKAVLTAFEKMYAEPCVLIVRMHPNVGQHQTLVNYTDKVINGSNYPDIQELYMASAALITDYSSTAFDCSLLGIPVFICALDYEQYKNRRSMTSAFEETPFPKAFTNEALIQHILNYDEQVYMRELERYKETIWMPFDRGNAAERTVNWLKERMTK